MANTAPARATPPAKPAQTVIDIAPSPDASQAVALRDSAVGLVIVDRASHQRGLEFIRGAKQLKRAIEEHWSRITRNVDDLKRNLLDLKRKDLDPVEAAIAIATKSTLQYQEVEDRRVREEEDRRRREAEEQAREDRERELAEQEARALRLEQDSPTLSNREAIFVEAKVSGLVDTSAATRAGFKDPMNAGIRLMNTPKIRVAIAAKRQAQAIREQAAAVKEQPLEVKETECVERHTGKVSGTRTVTTWSARVDDEDRLIEAVIAGTVPKGALMARQTFLTSQAEQLHQAFTSAYPGCTAVKKTTIAG